MSAGGDIRDKEREGVDAGKRSVSEDAVKGEAEEFGMLAVLKLRGGCSTSERAGGRVKVGIGGEVEGSGSMWHFLDGSNRADECSGVEGVEGVGISCVFW